MYHQSLFRSLVVALSLAGLAGYAITGGYFASELVVEIAILAILAISLDIVAGFGGMHSLFHGALMGVAAYGFGAATTKWGLNPMLAAAFALVLPTLFGASVGFIASRTAGIFFIMTTLAFGQLAYNVIYHTRALGGDDGMGGLPRLSLSAIGINLEQPVPFALVALTLVLVVYGVAALAMRSAFGRMLSGVHSNEARLSALGVNTRVIKTLAFALSSGLAGVAGVLAAQHTRFISPELLAWTMSGEVLIVVILGGLGTLAGPLVGAICFVLVKHQVTHFTTHWPAIIGLVLIATVLAGGRGLFGEIEARLVRRAVPAQDEKASEHA